MTTVNPDASALGVLPGACPGQGDSIDGLFDNYFSPGFSFAPGWGATRWFTSATVLIPFRVLRHAERIQIPLGATRAGTPPPHCAVPYPGYQSCVTAGTWSGVLTLRFVTRG